MKIEVCLFKFDGIIFHDAKTCPNNSYSRYGMPERLSHNPYLVKMVEEIVKHEILVPEYPQLTGAVGAALFAIEDGK
ncbi:MAG: hypothetical protein H8E10_10935 [Desulfobacterales bacterium]|nr:hypothetical protein [Desulfobacterales bacterium]